MSSKALTPKPTDFTRSRPATGTATTRTALLTAPSVSAGDGPRFTRSRTHARSRPASRTRADAHNPSVSEGDGPSSPASTPRKNRIGEYKLPRPAHSLTLSLAKRLIFRHYEVSMCRIAAFVATAPPIVQDKVILAKCSI